MAKPAVNYIDNKEFLRELNEFHELRQKNPNARVTESLGKSIILICDNLAKRYNFSGYSFRDDMVSDAIENCLSCITNFDPSKSENPFGYFTLVAYRAMLRRIAQEKRQHNIKFAVLENSVIDDTFADTEIPPEILEQLREFSLSEWGNDYSPKHRTKKKKGALDSFYEELTDSIDQ